LDQQNKKIFFASDFHVNDGKYNAERERYLLAWLDSIKEEAKSLYLVGDIFDYWFEYKEVIPKGFHRVLSKFTELKNLGIEIVVFTGNHDIWLGDFLTKELGISVFRSQKRLEIGGSQFYLEHGDGLVPNSLTSFLIKYIYKNKVCQWLFAVIHPNIGLRIMKFYSNKSREKGTEFAFNTPLEYWFTYKKAEKQNKLQNADYYIYGHMHAPARRTMSNGKSVYINLGEWITQRSYGVFDGEKFELKFYQNDEGQIIS